METRFSLDRALPLFEYSELQKRGIEAILEKYNLDKDSSAEEVEAVINECMTSSYKTQLVAKVIRAVYYADAIAFRRRAGW